MCPLVCFFAGCDSRAGVSGMPVEDTELQDREILLLTVMREWTGSRMVCAQITMHVQWCMTYFKCKPTTDWYFLPQVNLTCTLWIKKRLWTVFLYSLMFERGMFVRHLEDFTGMASIKTLFRSWHKHVQGKTCPCRALILNWYYLLASHVFGRKTPPSATFGDAYCRWI